MRNNPLIAAHIRTLEKLGVEEADAFRPADSGRQVYESKGFSRKRSMDDGRPKVAVGSAVIVPEAASQTGEARPRFAVQKHWARSLHYDFRLEVGGALASWAVPKGPSKDPKVKRFAIHVEDHPLDYLLFEGGLPEGEYGAGEVIVWDFGEFTVVETGGHDAAAALEDGIVRFVLFGKKLRGEWTIFRTRMGGGTRENWLLQKIADEFADADYDPETEPASALSGKVPRGRR